VKTKSNILSDEINQVLDQLPPALRDNVDMIRNFGNFGHILKEARSLEKL
jgi:hypothetical protein